MDGWPSCLPPACSGHVNRPCTVEEEMSIPLRELLERHAGEHSMQSVHSMPQGAWGLQPP